MMNSDILELTNQLIGYLPKLRGKYRNCYRDVTLEISEMLYRKDNMFYCYEDQLNGIRDQYFGELKKEAK